MARFYIDTFDQDVRHPDRDGREFENVEAAKHEAVLMLLEIARDRLPNGDACTFQAIVRDENGANLLQASLTLQVTSVVVDSEHHEDPLSDIPDT